MNEPRVVTFFYGSFMNPTVLREVGLVPDRIEVARLPGFDIEIRPLANLIVSDQHTVYGVLATTTHEELGRLYHHAHEVLGGLYLPRAVLAHTAGGQVEPALCYIAPSLSGSQPTHEYVSRILEPARAHGFPGWYIRRLESSLPRGEADSHR